MPGTAQAQEAAIAATIPQMATVYRAKVSFQPVVNGAPVLQPIPGTPLSYVFNSPDAILMVSPSQWYAVQMGVWFTAPSLQGPWVVASFVPAVIYTIPPSAPLFYTTFVQVYAATADTVVVGYTPGYMGVVVEPSGLVVYGTGYTYVAYVGATVWYPPPVTYGYAANLTYTPWTGFAVGFAIGWGVAHACYAPAPYWGACPTRTTALRRGLWRGGGLGTARLGRHQRQRLPPVRGDLDRQPQLRWLQRLDGQRLEQQGRHLLQLRHRPHLRRPKLPSAQYVHWKFRVQHARRHLQPQDRRRRRGQQDDRDNAVRPVSHLRPRDGGGPGRPNHTRGGVRRQLLRGQGRQRLQLQLPDREDPEAELQRQLEQLRQADAGTNILLAECFDVETSR